MANYDAQDIIYPLYITLFEELTEEGDLVELEIEEGRLVEPVPNDMGDL